MIGSYLVDNEEEEEVYKPVLSDTPPNAPSDAPPIPPPNYLAVVQPVLRKNPLHNRHPPRYGTLSPG